MITLKEFMKKYEDITLVGFAWSCYWRVTVAILIVYFLVFMSVALVVAILNLAFGTY